jgi:putative methionine-R-sulfoxide reductase with GAF domain
MDAVMEFVGVYIVDHDQTSIRPFNVQVKACVAWLDHNVTAYARRRKSFAGVECAA